MYSSILDSLLSRSLGPSPYPTVLWKEDRETPQYYINFSHMKFHLQIVWYFSQIAIRFEEEQESYFHKIVI